MIESFVRSDAGYTDGTTKSPVTELRNPARTIEPDRSDRAASRYALPYNAAIQDVRMTFRLFVETKFIPEHVAFKTPVGQRHYQAILKHLMTPEVVDEMFASGRPATGRLRAVPEWPYLDQVRLCDLTADHVRRLIHAADVAGYSSQTVKHIKNVLFAIVAHAQNEGCFHGANPAGLVKLPKPVQQNQQNLTLQQTRVILDSLPYPAKAVAMFTMTTGMTLTEICDLKWKHVNLGTEERYVDGELVPGLSLAVKASSNSATFGESRPADKNRIIQIHEPLLSTLLDLSWLNPFPDAGTRFVIARDAEKIPGSRFCTSELKKVGRDLGLPGLTWQVLRRAGKTMIGEFLVHLAAPGQIADSPAIAGGILQAAKLSPFYGGLRNY